MKDKELLIEELKNLYSQNLAFLADIENGTSKKKFSDKTILQFQKLNIQLDEYIQDLCNGLERNHGLKDWCNFFANVLLNDDNVENNN